MATITREPLEGKRRHKLMPREIRDKIPALYTQDGKGMDAIAYVKFFCPYGAATWYATEFDPDTGTFFGWADLTGATGELGYFTFDELATLTVFGGKVPAIERDCGWRARPLRECRGVTA